MKAPVHKMTINGRSLRQFYNLRENSISGWGILKKHHVKVYGTLWERQCLSRELAVFSCIQLRFPALSEWAI